MWQPNRLAQFLQADEKTGQNGSGQIGQNIVLPVLRRRKPSNIRTVYNILLYTSESRVHLQGDNPKRCRFRAENYFER